MTKKSTERRLGDLRELNVDGELTMEGWVETVEGFEVPATVEFRTYGNPEPEFYVRVEMREGVPQVVEVRWKSLPYQNEIKQKHLRSVELDSLATSMVAEAIGGRGSGLPEAYDENSETLRRAMKVVHGRRSQKENRVINDSLLRTVAQVYSQNISHAPTQAVAKFFGVKSRMASTYVDRARERGILPPTSQGKKRA